MKRIDFICIGKHQGPTGQALQSLEGEYLKRLTLWDFHIHEIKNYDDDCKREAKDVLALLKKIEQKYSSSPKIFLLKEQGKQFDSSKLFAKFLENQFEQSNHLLFIFGGAAGHDQAIEQLKHQGLSLSSLTFPHQFARLLHIEQIYRAQTIIQNHPYNK